MNGTEYKAGAKSIVCPVDEKVPSQDKSLISECVKYGNKMLGWIMKAEIIFQTPILFQK